ncbi:MAG: hypothetical protein ACRD2O_18640, partial [Terriglobia bacterium]
VSEALRHQLRPEHLERIQVSFYLFPETTGEDGWQPLNDGVTELRVMRLLEAADQAVKEAGKTVQL